MKRVRAVLDNGVDCESAAVRFLNLGHGAMSRGEICFGQLTFASSVVTS